MAKQQSWAELLQVAEAHTAAGSYARALKLFEELALCPDPSVSAAAMKRQKSVAKLAAEAVPERTAQLRAEDVRHMLKKDER